MIGAGAGRPLAPRLHDLAMSHNDRSVAAPTASRSGSQASRSADIACQAVASANYGALRKRSGSTGQIADSARVTFVPGGYLAAPRLPRYVSALCVWLGLRLRVSCASEVELSPSSQSHLRVLPSNLSHRRQLDLASGGRPHPAPGRQDNGLEGRPGAER
jgi:hypothetical protein